MKSAEMIAEMGAELAHMRQMAEKAIKSRAIYVARNEALVAELDALKADIADRERRERKAGAVAELRRLAESADEEWVEALVNHHADQLEASE